MSGPLPLARPLPATVLGARLRLEVWRADQNDAIRRLVARSQPTLAEFLPWAGEPVTEASEAAFQVESERAWRDGTMAGWTIVEDGELRGMVGLHRRGGPDELEIGYWLDDGATGRGLMTEACTMATDVAFGVEGIDAVEITHDRANVRSAAIPARLGYRRVAAFTSTTAARAETGVKVRWRVRRAEWLARGRPTSVLGTS